MTDLIDAFSRLVSLLVAFCGVAGTAYFIWGAYQYMSAGGSPQKAETGKTAMLQAGFGVILILVAFSVINTLTSQIGGSAGAVQIKQVAPTDSSRLVAPRVQTIARRLGGITVHVFFSEPVLVSMVNAGDLKLQTAAHGTYKCNPSATVHDPDRYIACTITPQNANQEVTFLGFLFQRGASIKDTDGNNAIYHFQPVSIPRVDTSEKVAQLH